MAMAKKVVEKVTKTVEVEEQVGVELHLTNDEAEYLATVLGDLPGRAAGTEVGKISQHIYDALLGFVPEFWHRKYQVERNGNMSVVLRQP